MKIPNPSFNEELYYWQKGYDYVVGIDEVGRGAFAGPVVAAGVVFQKNITTAVYPELTKIHDSKLLTHQKRTKLVDVINTTCLFSSISTIPVPVINKRGILHASYSAFRQVLQHVCQTFDPGKVFVLSDGFAIPYVKLLNKSRQKGIIKGDQKSLSIAAASILAKVHRDTLMEQLHATFGYYNFKENKGYGTKEHREAIQKYGLTRLHRTSFSLEKFLSPNP